MLFVSTLSLSCHSLESQDPTFPSIPSTTRLFVVRSWIAVCPVFSLLLPLFSRTESAQAPYWTRTNPSKYFCTSIGAPTNAPPQSSVRSTLPPPCPLCSSATFVVAGLHSSNMELVVPPVKKILFRSPTSYPQIPVVGPPHKVCLGSQVCRVRCGESSAPCCAPPRPCCTRLLPGFPPVLQEEIQPQEHGQFREPHAVTLSASLVFKDHGAGRGQTVLWVCPWYSYVRVVQGRNPHIFNRKVYPGVLRRWIVFLDPSGFASTFVQSQGSRWC